MKQILIFSYFLIISFIFITCAQVDDSEYWKKLGELNLDGKNLIVKVPKGDNFEEKYIRFYFASTERTFDNNNSDAYQIGFYNGDFLMLDKDDGSGSFEEEIYSSLEIKQDLNNYFLEIPNKFLFNGNMRLWSAYEKEVFVNDIKLYRKKTGKIDKKDPYPYILIIK